MAPDLLHDGSIMDTFHPNPRRHSYFGLYIVDAPRAGVRPARGLLFDESCERYPLAFIKKRAGYHLEQALGAVAVFEADEVAVVGLFELDDGADKIVSEDFHNDARFRWYLWVGGRFGTRVAGENVAPISIISAHNLVSVSAIMPRMEMRAQVYSPLQNTAVWLAAWLHGHEPTDSVLSALSALGGTHRWDGGPIVDMLREIRARADTHGEEPVLRLILWGPGQAAAIPAGSAAAAALTSAGALVVRGRGGVSHILVPRYDDNGVAWRGFNEESRLPEPAWLTPGEADQLLAQATDGAAALIEATGYRLDDLPNPRLTVGSLADFYDTPGLPSSVTPRAAKLFARADRVAAIIETVTDRIGDHSLDPHLFALWRHIRTARMAGVADAVHDYWRTS